MPNLVSFCNLYVQLLKKWDLKKELDDDFKYLLNNKVLNETLLSILGPIYSCTKNTFI